MESDDFYQDDQITVALIEKIKKNIMRNADDGPLHFKYFRDNNFKQTFERAERFPILLCVYFEKDILTIEKSQKK